MTRHEMSSQLPSRSRGLAANGSQQDGAHFTIESSSQLPGLVEANLALEQVPQELLSSLLGQHPLASDPGWIVSHMAGMTALEDGHPVALVVLTVADYRTFEVHRQIVTVEDRQPQFRQRPAGPVPCRAPRPVERSSVRYAPRSGRSGRCSRAPIPRSGHLAGRVRRRNRSR